MHYQCIGCGATYKAGDVVACMNCSLVYVPASNAVVITDLVTKKYIGRITFPRES